MADGALSKTQLDKLGERLRAGTRDEADIRTLDAYRNSFRPALVEVMDRLAALPYEKTGRMKTIDAIRAKLNRQPIRLTQIQDIAGFRITCLDPPAQETLTALLSMQFKGSEVDDLRERPSHVTMPNDLEASSRDQRTLDRELERIAASIERYAQKWRGLK